MRAVALAIVAGIVLAAASIAPAQGSTLELAGRVRTEDGAPFAGAAVALLPVDDTYSGARRAWTGEAAAPLARAVADRDGFYRLRAPGPGMYGVALSAAGRSPLEIAALPLVDPMVLPPATLAAAVETPVRVVDDAGRPIAGAVLRPVDESVDIVVPTWRPGWPARRSGADGRAAVSLPRKAGRVRWTVTAAGFAGRQVAISGPLTVALERAAGSSELWVREAGGRPVAGAFVATAVDDLPLAVTGEDGRARLALPPGPFEVLAADGRVWRGRLPRSPAGAAAGAPPTVTLPPPAAVAGGVVDAEDRRPLAGALVASTADLGRWALADARGSYALKNPGGPKAGLMAWAGAHFRGDAAPTAAIAAGGRGPTLALLPGIAVTGWVIDSGRRPVAGATLEARNVRLSDFRFDRRYTLSPAAAGLDGSFSILLPPHGGWSLAAAASGFVARSVALPGLSLRSRPPPLTIVLDAGRAAIGIVAGPDGAPIAGAEVQLLVAPEASTLLQATARASGANRGGFAATTGGNGAFRFQRLPAGRVAVVVKKPGYAPAVVPGLTIAAGQPATDLGTVRLLPGGALEGRVTDGRRPLAGARVIVQLSSRTSHSSYGVGLPPVATGDDGSFRFADLQPGTAVELSVSCAGFTSRSIAKVGVPTGRPLVVVLERAARIAGRVLDEGRSPVAGAQVRAEAEDRQLAMRQRFDAVRPTAADGTFGIDSAPSGHVRLEVTARGFARAAVTGLEVPAGGALEGIEVVLQRGAAVAGTVTTEDGLPVAGAAVDAGGAAVETDGDGAFRLEGVAPGRQRVAASHPDLGQAAQEVEIGPGETRVDLRLASGVALEGRVLDRAGAPVAGATVSLAARAFPELTESDAQGRFRFEHVAPGSYELAAGRATAAPGAPRKVEVGGEPLAGLDLTYDGGVTLAGRILGIRPRDLATLVVEAQGPKGGDGQGEVAADGSYRIEGLAPGDWLVTASASATGRRGQGQVAIAEGAAESHLDVELGAGLAVQGIVRWNGRPLDGAQVSLLSEAANASDATDPLGVFRLEGLAPGRATLTVEDPVHGQLDRRTLDLHEDQTVEIDFLAGGLAGSIVDGATGRPLDEVQVSAESPAAGPPGYRQARVSDAQGHFGFENLSPGAYAVTFHRAGYAAQTAIVSIEPQATATLAVALVPGGDAAPSAKP